jgi:subtilisin-like proprotein convertase family protein
MSSPSRKPLFRGRGWGFFCAALLVLLALLAVRHQRSVPGSTGDGRPTSEPVQKTDRKPMHGADGAAHSHRKDPAAAKSNTAAALNIPAGTATSSTTAVPRAVGAADEDPKRKLLAGESFTLMDRGDAVVFELAMDELDLPFAPVSQRRVPVPKQPDAASLIRLAETMKSAQGELPHLVIYPAGERRSDANRRILTDKVLIQLSDVASAGRIAAATDLRITSQPSYAPDYVIAESRTSGVASALDVLSRVAGQLGVVSASPMLNRQHVRRTTIPNDAFFAQQWHLRNTGQGGGAAGIDARVVDVWDTHKGSGVQICLIDDGVELTHPDLAANVQPGLHFDWNDSPNDTDPAPDVSQDFHGTSVAGVAAARGGNGVGVSGVAPLARIVGFRLISSNVGDDEEGAAMTLNNNVIDIKNNSWGPPDSQPWVLGTSGPLFRSAVQNGATNGRGGRGIIYPWAAGNGRDVGDQANKDAYANNIYTLAVGAVTNTGAQSSYSESGSNLVVCAPSSGGSLGIVTADLSGNNGYNDGSVFGEHADQNYTNDFGGTSSATPLVSGVVALMLEANPNLTWRDVKEILLRTSRKLSPTDLNWVTRNSGDPAYPPIKHNEKFGGGMVDALAAVNLATSWPARPAMIQMSSNQSYGAGVSIPDNNTTGIVTSFNMSAQPPMRVEHVEVTISATHTARGDMQILLTSPSGAVSTLAQVTPDDWNFGTLQTYNNWVFSSVRHWGESSVGTWRVTVRDLVSADTGNLQVVNLRLSGMAAVAQNIAVEQPAGTRLTAGISAVDFGNVATDNPGTRTITIVNTGDFPLNGVGASITSPGGTDFSVTVNPPATVGRSGTATFTVQFAPAVVGPQQATLHIASNDPDTASFDIDLNGNGTPAVGFLTFAAPAFTVLETGQTGPLAGPFIDIPIQRVGGSFDAVTIAVNSTDGSAVAPGDFAPQTGTIVSFGDGVVSGFIRVPIVDGPTTSESNQTFTVTLTNPTNGARIGIIPQAPVTIIDTSALTQDSDTAAPGAPVVTTPAEGALVPVAVNGSTPVTGTATDNKGIEKVEVSVNGGPFVACTMGIPGSTSTSFTASVTPATGPNLLQVRSTDYSGRFTIRTRNFKVSRPLDVIVDPALATVTTGFAPSSFREVGKSLTVMAAPKPPTKTPSFPGAVFTGWTIGGVDVANNVPLTNADTARIGVVASSLDKQTLTFIFREGMTLTANFVASPYDSTVIGTYNGLIKSSPALPDRPGLAVDGTPPGVSSEGSFTATVMGTGAFSGKLTIDGMVLNVAGSFDVQGRARFGTARVLTQTVARPNKPSLIVKFDIGGPVDSVAPPGKITGELTAREFLKSSIAAVSILDADRAYYTGLAESLTVPDAYLTVTGTATSPAGRSDGVFTVMMPSVPPASQPARISNVLDTADYPQGAGVGSIKVTKAGKVTLVATLADGTAVTASNSLSQTLRTSLFAQLYSLKGFLSVPVRLDSTAADSDLKQAQSAGSAVLWSRPFMPTSHYYPYGWREVLELDFLGAKYAATTGESVLKAADGVALQALDADGNATLSFSDGKIEAPGLVKSANLSTGDLVTKVPDNDPSFTMLVSRSTGMITGVFDHTDDTKPAYKAVIIQKGPNAGAYGYFLTKQPVLIDYTGQSGKAVIQGQP